MRRPLLACLASLSIVLGAPFAHAATPMAPDGTASAPTSATGASARPAPAARIVPMRVPRSEPAWRIELGASTPAEIAGLAARNRRNVAPASGLRGIPLAIGFSRPIATERPWQDLTWTANWRQALRRLMRN